jgi:hypothetical protein
MFVSLADSSELYRHANETIFPFLTVGGEGILVRGNNRGVRCAARRRKVWERLFDKQR